MPNPDEWLSIAEAATKLQITERHARRLAALISEDDKRTDTLATGRKRLAVRAAAIAQAYGKASTDTPPDMTGNESRSEGSLPAQLYQKIIADKDAEIQFLRSQLDQAQQNLAREQTLRALPPPAEPIESEAPKRWRWPWSRPRAE